MKLEAKIESLESECDYLLKELINSSKESNSCSTFDKVLFCFTTVHGVTSFIGGIGLGDYFPGLSNNFVYCVVEFIRKLIKVFLNNSVHGTKLRRY